MRRMAGEDAGFLYMELPVQPMNTMALAILEPARRADGTPDLLTVDRVHDHLRTCLRVLPSFRWRVERVPFGLHHPVYVEDPDFDLSYHIRHVRVAPPGGPAELDRVFAERAEHALDRRHPLWQVVLVDGVEGDRQAVICRVNHCLMDGVAALTTFSRIFSARDEPGRPAEDQWTPEPVPTATRLVVDALSDRRSQIPTLPRLVAKTWRNTRAARAHRRDAATTVPRANKDTPACGLNDAFTAARVYTRASLPIAVCQQVKDAAGVTLNDVALAVVAGALRRYLLDRDDLPERPLTASVPVAFEPADAPVRQWGNRFSSLTTSLCTDIRDPWDRLRAISRVTAEARTAFEILGPELLPEWLEFVPPTVAEAAMRAHHRTRKGHRDTADVSVLVSNIKGPAAPWSFDTATVSELSLSGPPSNGVGSNVMLWSYCDQLVFSILSFADAMQAPRQFGVYLEHALTELVAAAPPTDAPPPTPLQSPVDRPSRSGRSIASLVNRGAAWGPPQGWSPRATR